MKGEQIMSKSEDYCMSNFLIIEILLTLPVKTLIRFRCVCKNWDIIIRSSNFIDHHLNHCRNSSYLIVKHLNPVTGKIVLSLFQDKTLASEPLEYRYLNYIQMSIFLESVVGPFNGIIFIFGGTDPDQLQMWNLAMRECRSLPVPHSGLPPRFTAFVESFGIGLDPLTNYFKMVWIRYCWDDQNLCQCNYKVVSVYTSRSDSWRVFEVDFSGKGPIVDSLCNTYMNGAYYWLTIDNGIEYYLILSFDMIHETFRYLPGPPDTTGQWGQLVLYNNSVAMILTFEEQADKIYYIWVMKEEGFWNKLLTIGPLLEVNRPLGIWKNGEVFFESNESRLIMYNPSSKEVKDIGVGGSDFLDVFMFKDSLVPVKGVNECLEIDRSVSHYYETP